MPLLARICGVFVAIAVQLAATLPAYAAPPPPSAAPAPSTQPHAVDPASVSSLVYDLTKLISFFEQRGWTIGRYEIQKILPEALLSVCLCTPAVREAAARVLRRRIQALGGPSHAMWQRNGHDLSSLSDIISLERVVRLLNEAVRVAPAECPYWMEPRARFRGHQIDTDQITINLGGGGLFSLRKFHGKWLIGGGGSGRITASLPLSARWKVRLGPDLGGAALVGSDVAADNVEIDFVTSLPVAFRRFAGLYVYDVEVAPLALGMWWRDPVRYGVRLSGLLGLSAPRLRGVLPWTGVSAGVEWVAAARGLNAQWTLRMGLRFGFAVRVTD